MYLIRTLFFIFVVGFVYSKSHNKQADAIAELEKYIEEKKSEINQRYRLHYHIAGPVGWINDPNGFSFYKGEYHMFYQFYPYDSKWGPMHWGHVSSPDLVTWKQLPTALVPEEEMCFSGSAIVDGERLVLMYTAHIETGDTYNQTQYLAFSEDGVTFDKFEGNPVIEAAPNNHPDFRDPKVWKHEDYYYTVIGSRYFEERGNVLLYRSPDMVSWEFLSILGESPSRDELGYMWECPDFFELDGKFVLLLSPQGMAPQGDRYKNVHQTGYFIGSFNYSTFEFVPEGGFQEIDYGHDFYAAQTTENGGKRYIFGWFSSWDVPYPEAEDGWAGALTIARELRIVNNHINMKPVDAMVNIRDQTITQGTFATSEVITFGNTGEIILEGDLTQNIVLHFEGIDGGGQAWIRWDVSTGKVIVDRGNNDIRQVEWNPLESKSWRIFLDTCSVELFCGDGEVVFSSRVYPVGGWKVTNLSPQDLNIEAYTLKRSVPGAGTLVRVNYVVMFLVIMCFGFKNV